MPTIFPILFFGAIVLGFIALVVSSLSHNKSARRRRAAREAAERNKITYFVRGITDIQKATLRSHTVEFTECNLSVYRRQLIAEAAAKAEAEAAARAEEAAAKASKKKKSFFRAAPVETPAPVVVETPPVLPVVPDIPVDHDEDGILLHENDWQSARQALDCHSAADFAIDITLATGPVHEAVLYPIPPSIPDSDRYVVDSTRNIKSFKRVRTVLQSLLVARFYAPVELVFVNSPLVKDDGVFRVYFDATPGMSRGSAQVDAPKTAWGIPVGGGEQRSYVPSGRGTVITAPDGTALAELYGFNLYVYFDMFAGSGNFEHSLALLTRILLQVQPELTLDKLMRKVVAETGVAPDVEPGRYRTSLSGKPHRDQTRASEVMSALSDMMLVPVVGKNVHLRNGRGQSLDVSSNNKGGYNVVLWSAPSGEPTRDAPSKLFGLPVSHNDRAFNLTGQGLPIVDRSGYVVAEFCQDSLYVHYDLMRNGSLAEARVFARLLIEVREMYRLMSGDAETRAVAMQSRYVDACLALTEPLATPGLHCDSEALANKQQEVHEHLVQTRGDEHALFQLEAAPDTELGQEFDRLTDVANVIDVKVTSGKLTVVTEVLFCRDPSTGLLHEIGAFDIEIPTEGGEIRWLNRTRKVRGYQEGMNAPHVFAEGNACLGNVKDLFPQLIRQRDYASCVQVAIAFIESVNINDSAGRHIGAWPVASED